MIRRAVTGGLGFKALAALLVLGGLSEKSATLIVTGIVAGLVGHHLRAGIREQFIEPPEDQAARLTTNLVWDNARWINAETPEQGIERLTAPPLPKPQPRHAPHELALGGAR